MNASAKIVRWAVGVIFVAAGALKLARPADFYSGLLAYEVPLPDFFLRLVAVALPRLEILCGGALLANFWTETVGFPIAALLRASVLLLGAGSLWWKAPPAPVNVAPATDHATLATR